MNDPEASQDYTGDIIGTLDSQTSLGQSFVSRRTGLNGITIWLSRLPTESGSAVTAENNVLSVRLYTAPGAALPVYAISIVIPASGNALPVAIPIPDQHNAPGQSYYLQLSNPSGSVQINGRNEDAYPQGQAYANNQPLSADFSFRLTYDYGLSSLLADVKATLPYLWLIAPLLVIVWLPGWLLLEFSTLRSRFDFGEQSALALGLSLAIIPLLMLWTSILKVRWTGTGIYFATGFLLAIFITRITYNLILSRKSRHTAGSNPSRASATSAGNDARLHFPYSLALILIFLSVLAVRLVMIRDLATPAWVDSVHHALITRIILVNGSIPSTYQPYFDFTPSAYHPGFHVIAAAFTWLSTLDLARSLLILGQVLNAVSVFPVYLFTRTLTRSSSAGLFAAVITGFITPMPAYYTSWGRYTELTGLLLLPVVLALLRLWLDGETGKGSLWVIALGALTGGGLFLIHYRVLAFLVCLVISYVLLQLFRNKGGAHQNPGHLVLYVLSMAGVAIILVIPWFIQAFQTILLPHITTTIAGSVKLFQDFAWSYLTSAYGTQAMALAGLGLLWGLVNRKRFTIILILWIVLLFILANLVVYKLPLGGLVSNASVEIMLFIPISVLGGYFFDQMLFYWKALLPFRLVPLLTGAAVIFIGVVAYLGARQLVPILNPVTILSRNADVSAIAWVSDNIPAGETMVINPFAWGDGLYAGNDGGYWISPLSGRLTLPPPVIYGLGPGAAEVSQLSQQVISLSADPAALRDLLHAHQLDYIFIGARGGVLSPAKLSASGLFDLIYHQDGAWIFRLKP